MNSVVKVFLFLFITFSIIITIFFYLKLLCYSYMCFPSTSTSIKAFFYVMLCYVIFNIVDISSFLDL